MTSTPTPKPTQIIIDTECYPNYWLAMIKPVGIKDSLIIEAKDAALSPNDRTLLNRTLANYESVGFNSIKYDLVMIAAAIKGFNTGQLKELNDELIRGKMMPWIAAKAFNLDLPDYNHIDLIEVCPLIGSLKTYAARLNCKTIQDLPYDPDELLTDEQIKEITEYCYNDLENTELLLTNLSEQLDLRRALSRQYGVDLRSKSDAQIAEKILSIEITRLSGVQPSKPNISSNSTFRFNIPENIKFSSPQLKSLLDTISHTPFTLDGNGAIKLPESIKKLPIQINNSIYRIGVGGLHSTEEKISHKSNSTRQLIDFDVSSYYPNIILNQGLYPEHLDVPFLDAYKSIVDRRLQAKKSGDKITADSLKICANSCFGKFGSKYSILYSPQLLLQVTLSGQLYLLMLIESLESAGIQVISANTDGIVTYCPIHALNTLQHLLLQWQATTGLTLEETRYKALYSRDVNNYIAVKDTGCKLKGVYSNPWSDSSQAIFRFHKNPVNLICIEAMVNLILNDVSIEDTVRACRDPFKFVSVRAVKGGAIKNGKYLGKTVRWYYGKGDMHVIQYADSGNKVPASNGAIPCQMLDVNDVFNDLDYDYYIKLSNEMLTDIGYIKQFKQLTIY